MNVLKFGKTGLLAGATLALVVTSAAASAGQMDGAKYMSEAQVKLPQARAIALKAVHGKIVSEELEKERGGSGLRYSFDIRAGGKMHEVGVDAKDGKILENGIESESDEAKEADDD